MKVEQEKENTLFNFPRVKVIEMGRKINSLIQKDKPSKEERNILEYARTYVLFRKYCLYSKRGNPYLAALYESEKKLNLEREEILLMHFWLRGSRTHLTQFRSKKDFRLLYDRIDERLNNPS